MLKPWCVRYQENIIQIYILWVIISKINYPTKRGNTCQKQLDSTWSAVQKAHSSYQTFYASILSIIIYKTVIQKPTLNDTSLQLKQWNSL